MGNSLQLRRYFVAFIDVLGQTNEILKLKELPEKKEIADKYLHDTAGYIVELRNCFKDLFDTLKKSTGKLDQLLPEQKIIAEKLRQIEVLITSFSDTITISVPLDDNYNRCLAIHSIRAAMLGICLIFVVALAQNKPFRCGIDVGTGVMLTEQEVYGEALVKAYNLENNVARYPRIVVGDSLFDYISDVKNSNSNFKPNDYYASRAHKEATECQSIVTQDYDKMRILDNIGTYVHSIPDMTNKIWVEAAYKFIIQSHNTYKLIGNLKLSSYYGWLRSYFEPRLSIWDLQPITSNSD